MVLNVPGLQHATGLCVVVGVNHHGLQQIHSMVREEQMLSKSRGSYPYPILSEVSVFQSSAVFMKTTVQRPTRLANVVHSYQGYFAPCRTLRLELVHPKDPVPANRRNGVVYSIPCAEYPRTYIGQTGRSLGHRLQLYDLYC